MPAKYLLISTILFLVLSSFVNKDLAMAEEKIESPAVPWTIKAQKITSLNDGNILVAEGDVFIVRGNMRIRADYARYYRETDTAEARGHLILTIGEDVLFGEEALVNLKNETGTVRSGNLFLKKNNVHLKAAEIVRIGEDRYILKSATITTCDQDPPPWSFKSQELDLTVEGYAVAKNSSFRIKSLPVLYTPYLVFPAKTQRQSGLLFPEFSYGQRYGLSLNLPIYWAIDPSSDATFYQHYMSNRGLMEGLEYRYVKDDKSKGAFLANYLYDSLEDNDFNNDGFVRNNRNRWWLRGMADQNLPLNMRGLVNLDLVSDRDYHQEFDDSYTGFSENKDMLFKNFGRTLLDKTSLIRESTVQINRRWTNYSFSGQGRYYENLDKSQQETTLQVLPSLNFQAIQQPLSGTPLFYEGSVDYVNYWRQQGTGMHRVDLFPRVAWPTKLGYLDFRASTGLRETIYDVQNYGNSSSGTVTRTYPTRTLQYYEINLSTQLDRVFKLSSESISKVKHSIVPSLVYSYIPAKYQEDLPNLDGADRVGSQNLLSYSLANYVTIKQTGINGPFYRDIFRLRLSQSYSVKEERKDLDAGDSRRPFSNVLLEGEFLPTEAFYLRYDTSYNPYDGLFERDHLLLRASDKRGDSLFTEYLYSKNDSIHELNVGVSFVVTKSVSVELGTRYSIELKKNLEGRALIKYYAQCWGVSLQFTDTLGDRRVSILFSLYGLGQFGPVEMPAGL